MLARGIDPRATKDLAVGDRVFLQGTREADRTFWIHEKKPRTSFISRPRGDWTRSIRTSEEHVLAANVDVGVITVSVREPDFHPRFIDRYLAILRVGGVHPLICVTKTDLGPNLHSILDFYRTQNVPVVETSFIQERGIEHLKDHIRGKTSVFLGQSGVGKSSLISMLAPYREVGIAPVSSKTGKGRHTTTSSQLLQWEENSYMIDTPGIRSLGVDQIPREELRSLFPEFQQLSQGCRFSDCLHMSEPDCAIKQAVEAREPSINKDRYDSYVKMMQE